MQDRKSDWAGVATPFTLQEKERMNALRALERVAMIVVNERPRSPYRDLEILSLAHPHGGEEHLAQASCSRNGLEPVRGGERWGAWGKSESTQVLETLPLL